MNEEIMEIRNKTTFGFWLYLLTDSMLFAVLFAIYVVLRGGDPGAGKELFDLPFALTETLVLLTSSFICGLMMVAVRFGQKKKAVLGLIVTALLGLTFLIMELTEFSQFVAEGNSWQASGFLSAFFTLVGTHGLHITVGLLWAGVLLWWILKRGLTEGASRRLELFSIFWHFLDLIWIFIFTVVYLSGEVL